jgi:hypothetical protein
MGVTIGPRQPVQDDTRSASAVFDRPWKGWHSDNARGVGRQIATTKGK